MTVATIYSETGDGFLGYTYTTDYNIARDASSANYINTSANTIGVGWGSAPALFRGYLYFNTSTDNIPTTAVISVATLKLYVPASCPTVIPGGMDTILFNGQPTYPTDPLEVGDFDRTLYSSGGANKINVTGADNEWKTFTLNATGFTWINLGAGVETKLCLRSEFDVSPTIPKMTEPTGMEVIFYSSNNASYKPTLTITYETKPAITTDAADGLGPTYVTGNGTMDSQGDGSISEYGFIYNDDGTDPVDIASADNKTTSSNLGGGTFSASLTGLDSATTYYYRAYMTTSVGTGYGGAVQFTTSSAADVLAVSTPNATSVDVTTATLNGAIDSDGGDNITEHGFVYKLGGDPGTPVDPTTADNYTEEGAGAEGSYNSAVASLTKNSFYMFRAYAESDAPDIDYGGVNGFYTDNDGTTVIDGLSGDGSLYTYNIWGIDNPTCGETSRTTCKTDTVAVVSDTGPPNYYCYADRVVLLTNEATFDLEWLCWTVGAYYNCHQSRAYIYFDTSSLAGKTITSVTLGLYVTSSTFYNIDGGNSQGFAIGQNGAGTYPSESGGSPNLAVGDFNQGYYSNVGTVSAAAIGAAGGPSNVNQYMEISLAVGTINKTGLTKFEIKQTDRVPWQAGTYNAHTYIQTADGANKPYLDIDYTEDATIPMPDINIGDTWKDVDSMQINIGDTWKDVEYVLINVGDEWKPLAS